MKNLLFLILVFAFSGKAQLTIEQQAKVDSLKGALKFAKHDSMIVKSWVAWDKIVYASDPELDFILNQKIDSLCTINLDKNPGEQEKLFFQKYKGIALGNMGDFYRAKGDYSRAIISYNEILSIYRELGDKKGIAKSFNKFGVIFKKQGDYARAIENYTKSLTIYQEIGDKEGLAGAYFNIGVVYTNQGNSAKAINYQNKSLKIQKEIGDQIGVAKCYNSIAIIYHKQEEYTKALENYLKGLKIREEIGDRIGVAQSYNNLGALYSDQDDFSTALDYHSKSLTIKEELGDKNGMANSYNNSGLIYQGEGEYDKALSYFMKSLTIYEELGNKNGVATSLNNIAETYEKQDDHLQAKNYSLRALTLAQEIGAISQIKYASKNLFKVYKSLGNYKESLSMYELYINMRDSIKSEENQKEIIRQELKYTYQKQADSIAIEQRKKEELALAEQKRKDDLAAKENEKKNLIIAAVVAGLALVLIFTFFVINRLRITRKQKGIIEEQKAEVEQQKSAVEIAHKETERQKLLIEEAHTEITDSINYAKRLQDAILPSLEEVNKHLSSNFILFKPKDVVSGDFYWFENLNGTSYIAAADCTGHGVPGAMVSVVCSNALNRSVKEFGITEPAKILDKTRALVIETFAKSGSEVKDGMDIALCSIKDNKVTYAGANNPLWIVRKTELLTEGQKQERSTLIQDGIALIEYKADKQPIGLYAGMQAFSQKEIDLYKGDSLYFFTDGFADQFGGDKGKKFKYRPFKKLLIQLNSTPMSDQEQLISAAFENWQGNLEQVDDVCVIGVRV